MAFNVFVWNFNTLSEQALGSHVPAMKGNNQFVTSSCVWSVNVQSQLTLINKLSQTLMIFHFFFFYDIAIAAIEDGISYK